MSCSTRTTTDHDGPRGIDPVTYQDLRYGWVSHPDTSLRDVNGNRVGRATYDPEDV